MTANTSPDRQIVTVQPLFLKREDAAAFLSISASHLENLVARGEAPKPRQISKGRTAWLVEELVEWGRKRPVSDLLPPSDSGHGRRGKKARQQSAAGVVPEGARHG